MNDDEITLRIWKYIMTFTLRAFLLTMRMTPTLPLMTQPVAVELAVAVQCAATEPVASEAAVAQTFPGRSWAAVAPG